MQLLQTKDLSKIYGKGASAVHALKGVNLSIEENDFIAIVGTSGSGKSTLLHLLSGLDVPTGGSVYYKRQNISNANQNELAEYRAEHIGFVFQFFNLVPILTVEENIFLPVLINGGRKDETYIRDLIDLLGLKNKLRTPVSKLSGGQQQRVAIARALSKKPDIVFADEPTGALDSKMSEEIMQILSGVHRQLHQTIVVVTHDPIVASYAQRIIRLEDGMIAEEQSGRGRV